MTYTFQLNFADAEVPVRSGAQLYLQHKPDQGSLRLYRNGLLMLDSFGDYQLVAGQIVIPSPPLADDDKVVVYYRYTTA